MHLLPLLLPLLSLLPSTHSTRSPKRGLVYIPKNHPTDDQLWDAAASDLTWYYNYGASPSAVYASPSAVYASAPNFQFVPMLWGAPASSADTTFLDTVKAQLASGANISHVLTFNEPDGQSNTGGSAIPAATAAEIWKREVEPLKKLGVKLGAPAVTGAPTGFNWLAGFFKACAGGCSVDFIPVHWYGNFEGLAGHLGQVRGTYPNMTVWVTEYAAAGVGLADSQGFFNTSAEYFDRLPYVERYSYFGSFRSDVSNVGPNAAMLTQDGKLTDIGSWYLGGSATGNVPQGPSGSSANSLAAFAGSSLVVVLAMFWCLA